MTIRRQYSLPNCTLVLEGYSEGAPTSGGQFDTRPLMTILVNAECHFSGIVQPLRGGRDFLESLVRAVSRYAQEFLSQVHHPKLHDDKPELVKLQKLPEKNLHQLTLLPTADTIGTSSGLGMTSASHAVIAQETPLQLDLTTVQLFDLVEAIDQFLADRRTLPDFSVSLEPLPKRLKKADEPIAKRAAPATLGVTGLALSAIALSLLPIPEVRQPKAAQTKETARETPPPSPEISPSAAATPKPTPPDSFDVESALASAKEITDPTELDYLELNLRKKLNKSWEDRGEVNENLEYQVSVGRDGAIVGYKPIKNTPTDGAKQTPLPDLLYTPAQGGVANSEAMAQFRVRFTKTGVVEISQWRGRKGEPGLGPEITDSAKVSALNEQLRKQLLDNWKEETAYPRELVYRIGVTEEGVIADYEPINAPAWDYLQKTPLESLTKPEAAGIGSKEAGVVPQKPLAQFRVEFKPDRNLEISSWR